MNLLQARNVHDMLPLALDRLFKAGVKRDSRNGEVLQLEGPTILCYEMPTERVVFWPERDANPFFHLLEAVWMLSGRNDVEPMAELVPRMKEYSDNGKTFYGAYGYRWRFKFGYNQPTRIIENLRNNPNCRRQVLAMWDPYSDLDHLKSKDVPCNTHIYLARNRHGALDMTVCNRSNDLVWGALGANAVHMSVLQEYMADRIGCCVGRYYQFTNNLHGYLTTIEPLRDLAGTVVASPYELGHVTPRRIRGDRPDFNEFLESGDWYDEVVHPMRKTYQEWRRGSRTEALALAQRIEAPDWRRAATEWMLRRIQKEQRAQDDGVTYDQ